MMVLLIGRSRDLHMIKSNEIYTYEQSLLSSVIMRRQEIRTCYVYTEEQAKARLDELEIIEKMIRKDV